MAIGTAKELQFGDTEQTTCVGWVESEDLMPRKHPDDLRAHDLGTAAKNPEASRGVRARRPQISSEVDPQLRSTVSATIAAQHVQSGYAIRYLVALLRDAR